MHPNTSFAWTDEREMLAFVADVAFCTIFVPAGSGAVLHVPVTVADGPTLRFHVARHNRGGAALDGAYVWLSCLGEHGYVSPDWYGTADQVPTWNYIAVEAEGSVRQVRDDELADHLDSLAAAHEARLVPKRAWTRGKMTASRFEAMLGGIQGFELSIRALRGTRKLGQNKKPAEHAGAIAGLETAGATGLAALMRISGRE